MVEIRIIGTSHIAPESVARLEQAISASKPDIVAIELDAGRFEALQREESSRPGLGAIWELGITGFLFAHIGGFLQKKLGSKISMRPGDDMRAAIRAAKAAGSRIVLIDRPIQRTLAALSKELGAWERTRFMFYMLGALLFPFSFKGFGGAKKVDLAKVPTAEIIDTVLSDLKRKFPKLHKVLIGDRNRYMARNIRKLAERFPESKILVAVGAGHEKALLKILEQTNSNNLKAENNLSVDGAG